MQASKRLINPNKAGLFESSFFWGETQFDLPSYFKKNLPNINIKNADIICYKLMSLVSL